MSENTLLYALLGWDITAGRPRGTGFVLSASSLLNELGFDADVIERQLSPQGTHTD